MNFASDNTSAVHPRVMQAIIDANAGYAPSYGSDDLTAAAEARVREVLDAPDAAVFLVAGGTAANALSLATVSPPWGKIFCSDAAHVLTSECGAIPFYSGGAELVPVRSDDGLIDEAALVDKLHAMSRPDVHAGERAALTLTNSTEGGRVYSPDTVAALARRAKAAGLAVHVDGARFGNAVAALGCTPAELSHRAGVDILSFGGTKNGAMMVEAVVVFDPARARGLDMRRMRAGHLMSKHRFLAAQMLALLEDRLWLQIAANANAMAARLSAGLAGLPGVTVDKQTDANQVFATLPTARDRQARAAGAQYHEWPRVQDPAGKVSVRLVCSWSTTEADVDDLLGALTA